MSVTLPAPRLQSNAPSHFFETRACRGQVALTVKYKGFSVGEGRVDLLVGGELIVELKSVEQLAAVHVAQVISYLKAFDRRLGLLITFNVKLLRSGIRRVVVGR